MENHPIPQNVTSFQFKLIGNMTIKQFAYLAGGAILAWIFFSLPLFFLIKFPLAFVFLILGFGLAFIPIEGRPLDVMLTFFLRSLFAPNQYIFQKTGGKALQYDPPHQKKQSASATKTKAQPKSYDKLQSLLSNLPKKPKNKMDEKEMVFFQSLSGILAQPAVSTNTPAHNPVIPSSPQIISLHEEDEKQKEEKIEKQSLSQVDESQREKEALEKEALLIKRELEQAKAKEVEQNQPEALIDAHKKAADLEKQLNEVLRQREQLEKELLTLKSKVSGQSQQIFSPSNAQPPAQTQNVKKIPKSMGKSIGMPISPDIPNLIMGIVKDPRGNVLPNILVEVKDKEDNPVRAFKTNGIGQFASATPLLNGIYTILFEDPQGKNKFDTIELPIIGEIVPVIEIISVDSREELRKTLFN
ncbi:MAG: PrgI family protein [Candidatus Levybacteria bacterium]|nr:PrgI family protein [Candidatus Levybacteria bacterium]